MLCLSAFRPEGDEFNGRLTTRFDAVIKERCKHVVKMMKIRVDTFTNCNTEATRVCASLSAFSLHVCVRETSQTDAVRNENLI